MKFVTDRRFWAVALGLCLASLAWAADVDEDPDEEKAWKEAEVVLPAFPEEADLLPFPVGPRNNMRFMVDGKSISIGADDVIRYTLVVVSSQGARNISFEGIRCETAERRTYAFGRQDGTWSKARSDQWRKISGGATNQYVVLYAQYFCAMGLPLIAGPERYRVVLRQGGVGIPP